MTTTTTYTTTYTVVDVRKTFESLEADLRMLARRTKAQSQDWAERTSADLLAFAEKDYVTTIDVILYNKAGVKLRAKKYRVDKDAGSWSPMRPGDNNWPQTSDGRIRVVISHTNSWKTRSSGQRSLFFSQLAGSWGPTDIDTSHSDLSQGKSRSYSSNAYGLGCVNYGG